MPRSNSHGSYSGGDGSDEDCTDVVHVAELVPLRKRPQSRPQARARRPQGDDTANGDEHETNRMAGDGDERQRCDAEEENDDEEEGVGVMIAMTLLVVGFLALVGYIGYQIVMSDDHFARRMPTRPQAEAKHLQIQVDLAQLYSGHQMQVEVDRKLVCQQCAGSGMDLAAGFHRCHKCDGTGVQTFVQQIGSTRQHVRSVYVAKYEGDQAPHAIPGDVIVHLKVRPHPVFTRRENDLELHMEITLLEALVGFTNEIVHLDNRIVVLARKDVVSPTTVWKIPHEGMPIRGKHEHKGDLLIHFTIMYPDTSEVDGSVKEAIAEILPN
uniref:Chaperone DnaJ C-terminal domain-containing protein n=1 Tax=Globisporangium ultimum (strain ATCC 200006 / CBS 805.95 / DAOM BR144) TaxID=431595 RepID=K3WRH1_GLOUD